MALINRLAMRCRIRRGTVNLGSCGRSANHIASYVTRDLVNRGGEPAKIALGLLKLTVPRLGMVGYIAEGLVIAARVLVVGAASRSQPNTTTGLHGPSKPSVPNPTEQHS